MDEEIKIFLEEKVRQYNHPGFIEDDPISVPHRYSRKEDIEISAFLAATISWGNRVQIVKNAHRLLDIMGESPFDFIMSHQQKDLEKCSGFYYRTFNEDDLKYFVLALKNIYTRYADMESIFVQYATTDSLQGAIHHFRNIFFALEHHPRMRKHVSDPLNGSAAKKINMFLRWLIRKDASGVDLGIWKQLKPSQLSCPLDVHSAGIARKLGLLSRKQNDAKAVQELDAHLRRMDPQDPVKYDFALFGLGIFEKF